MRLSFVQMKSVKIITFLGCLRKRENGIMVISKTTGESCPLKSKEKRDEQSAGYQVGYHWRQPRLLPCGADAEASGGRHGRAQEVEGVGRRRLPDYDRARERHGQGARVGAQGGRQCLLHVPRQLRSGRSHDALRREGAGADDDDCVPRGEQGGAIWCSRATAAMRSAAC